MRVIVDEAARLGRLADQLLHLSRYDAGIHNCAQEPVPLEALLQDVTEQLQPLAADRQVTLHCELNVCCEVLGDDIRLSQVFFNVLENAIKYAPGGKVAVRLRLMEQWAVVDVEDNGEGIPDPALPHVFERFYRVDSSRQRESGGLASAFPSPGRRSSLTKAPSKFKARSVSAQLSPFGFLPSVPLSKALPTNTDCRVPELIPHAFRQDRPKTEQRKKEVLP